MRCVYAIYEASMRRGRRRQNVLQCIKVVESGHNNVEEALETENCETQREHGERQRIEEE